MGDVGQKIPLGSLGASYLLGHVRKALGQASYFIIALGADRVLIVPISDLGGSLRHLGHRAGNRVRQDKGNTHRQQHNDPTNEQERR